MAQQNSLSFFQVLLGKRQNVQEALDAASQEIARIGEENRTVTFRTVRRSGASSTKLYEFRAPREHQKV